MVIIHKDEPGVIGMLAGEVAAEGINIPDMINKSRGDLAYNVIDLETKPSEKVLSELGALDDVINVREV